MRGNPSLCGPFPPKNTSAIDFQGQDGYVTYTTFLRACPRECPSEKQGCFHGVLCALRCIATTARGLQHAAVLAAGAFVCSPCAPAASWLL